MYKMHNTKYNFVLQMKYYHTNEKNFILTVLKLREQVYFCSELNYHI